MARTAYDAIFSDGPDAIGAGPFLRALATEGRVRRSAREMAQEDLLEGTWATVTEDEAAAWSDVRMAAQDERRSRTYTDASWRITVELGPDGDTTFTLEAGSAGATVELDGEPPRWIPLVLGEAVRASAVGPLPGTLTVLDARGRRVRIPAIET